MSRNSGAQKHFYNRGDDMTPLAGKRIIDLTRYAPGPYASLVCASLGAEVVKIETPPNGDPLRKLDESAFDRLNAGKKSLLVNLNSRDEVSRLLSLIRTADVLIEGFRPGVIDQFGLDHRTVIEHVPSIIYVSISGYGQSGPYAHRAGHDLNYMATAGALYRAQKPLPFQFADFAAGGLYAVINILAALIEGQGGYFDLSMHDGLISLAMLSDGPAEDALSGRYPNYTVYETLDGKNLVVGALENKFWKEFCRIIKREDLVKRGSDPNARIDVAEIIKRQRGDEWEALFENVDACVELAMSVKEAQTHEQSVHRGRSGNEFKLPFELEHTHLSPAPKLGEHNNEILSVFG